MIQSALDWVRGEQTEGIVVLCIALVIIAVGVLLPRLITTPYAKVAMPPLVIVGVGYCAIGAGIFYNAGQSKKDLLAREQTEEIQQIAQTEKARVEGFERSYTASKIVSTLFMLTAALLIWFAKSPTGQGIAIGLILFALLAVSVDYFSKERADIYYQEIVNTLNE